MNCMYTHHIIVHASFLDISSSSYSSNVAFFLGLSAGFSSYSPSLSDIYLSDSLTVSMLARVSKKFLGILSIFRSYLWIYIFFC